MKNLLLLCLFLLSFSFLSSAQIILTGKLIDETSKPVNGALVKVLNTGYSASSNGEGIFNIHILKDGSYILNITCVGYASTTKQIISGDQTDTIEIVLKPFFKQLTEVTITTDKRDELMQSAALSITALSSAQVNNYRLWTMNDLTSIAPNLYTADPGDKRNVTAIRGIVSSSYDPAITTYIDGVNQFGLDTYIAQLFDVESIEIARGPQGTLYGRNAMGGVINIITKRPENKASGFAEMSFSNYSRQRVTAGLRIPLIQNKLFFGAAGLFDRTDGFYKNLFTGSDYDRQHSASGNYYLKYLPGKSWDLTLNLKHTANRNTGAFPLVFDQEQAVTNPFILDQNAVTDMVDNIFNSSVSFKYSGRALNFVSQTAYQSNYRYYRNPIDADFSSLDGMSIINNYGADWNNVKVYSQEFKVSSAASTRLNWIAGSYLFYQHNPVKQTTRFGNDALLLGLEDQNFSLINTSTARNKGIAFYAQAEYKLTKKLAVTTGLRYDRENKRQAILGEYQKEPDPMLALRSDTSAAASFNAFSPKLKVAYYPSASNTLFLTYTKGFRAGGLTPLSFDPSQPALLPFNPEVSNSIEAGSKNTLFDRKLTVNLSVFYSRLSDVQVPTLILPDAITVIKNTGELTSKGAELELRTVFNGIEIDYSFGYTNARYDRLKISKDNSEVNLEGKRQVFTPKATSMLAAQYHIELNRSQDMKLVLRSEWRYLGRQYFDLANTISQAPFNTANAKLGVAAKEISIMLWARNINNARYIAYAYDFGGIHLGNPRTFGVTVSKTF